MRKTRVTVLMGGPSAEHDVSLASGKAVVDSLDKGTYEVLPIVINKKGEWPIDLLDLSNKTDVVFIAMHGEYGEDGTVQNSLRQAGIPYTGSDPLSSALAMNKILTSRLFRAYEIVTPQFAEVSRSEPRNWNITFDLPAVVKPSDRGSSVGVSIVRRESEIEEALDKAFRFSRTVLIQEYIEGREITCSVIDDGEDEIIPLPPTEIIPKVSSFFDYHAKYTPGASEEITPANLGKEERDLIEKTAALAHKIVGASGMSRTDMILTPFGELYFLEINTIPGMTGTSLFPQAALAHGLSLAELYARIIEAAIRRHGLIL